jgi:hypothetical protein
MKPATIRRFDMFYLAWVALTVVDFLLQHGAYVAQVNAAAAQSGIVLGTTFVTVAFGIWTLFMLLLWYLVSHKRSVVAKWIIVVLVVLGVFGVPTLFEHALTTAGIASVLALLVSVVAAWSLFGPEAKAWFAGDGPAEPVEEG